MDQLPQGIASQLKHPALCRQQLAAGASRCPCPPARGCAEEGDHGLQPSAEARGVDIFRLLQDRNANYADFADARARRADLRAMVELDPRIGERRADMVLYVTVEDCIVMVFALPTPPSARTTWLTSSSCRA